MRLTPYHEFLALKRKVENLGSLDIMLKFDEIDREMGEMGDAIQVLLKMAQELKAALENQETNDASKLAQIAATLDGYQKNIEAFTSPAPDNGGSTGDILD